MDEYEDREIKKRADQTELQKGREYIIKRTSYDPFYIKVLDVTKTCYRFQYESGNTDWVLKDYYNSTYTFVEDITEFRIQQNVNRALKQTFETCGMCGGTGKVADEGSTAMTKTCPVCWGAGQVLKSSTFKEFN
jgi:hypothetical protein